MKDFARLFHSLDQTNKTNERLEILQNYFRKAPEQDQVWTIALLSGKRPKRPVNTTKLREWASDLSEIPPWLLDDCYEAVGDLAEMIALVLPPPKEGQDETLGYWMNYLLDLNKVEEEERKKRVISAWNQMDLYERFAFNKVLTGAFRIGISRRLLTRALSQLHQIEESEIAHRLMGDWNPKNINLKDLLLSEDEYKGASKPYPFFLAYQLDKDINELGAPDKWEAEWKWDGIRSQIIKRKDKIFIWSRGEELVTDKFPELAGLNDLLPNGTVIDGEILAYKDESPLEFNVLQRRIGRKEVTKGILEKAPVVLFAFDLLEYKYEDIRDWPYIKRRERLAELTIQVNHKRLRFSTGMKFKGWDQLSETRNNAREYGAEGLMLKHKDSVYGVGRKKADWWKWKVDPFVIDAVLIYAQPGSGRRASLYTDYTFGVWAGENLVPIAKAYSGLTDQEIREVDSYIKKNTVEKFGPVRSVEPKLVFEIAFENIQKSSRHKSGIAVRFPRISRWRRDKKVEEADTLQNLLSLLNNDTE